MNISSSQLVPDIFDNPHIYRFLGAHPLVEEGQGGVRFALWAPGATQAFVVLEKSWPMQRFSNGVWCLFIPGVGVGAKYQFDIETESGRRLIKNDPLGFAFELRGNGKTLVQGIREFAWTDDVWMRQRTQNPSLNRPINIYEVHLGSWRGSDKEFPTYREIAVKLGAYVQEMGFTHVEFLPLMEHPLDESWGYQVTGFFAPTSRYGSVEDFQYLVNEFHRRGIGVILDWVPAHFPLDDTALAQFCGEALYEYEDPKQGFHPHWNTAIFNYARKEIVNFLIASALFWIEEMHIDGLRVDAVASMLYCDYGRGEGEWVPNRHGSNENLEAIEFLKKLNLTIHQRCPGVLMIAEESTAFPGVCDPQGLGFDLKWNMGWMNDTLVYFSQKPSNRAQSMEVLRFGLLYLFSERYLLPLSHDEVVHEKNSLLTKVEGAEPLRFANLKNLLSYQMGHPGKKLLFMGNELGSWKEWDCKGVLDWALLDISAHKQMQKFVYDLNHFYLARSELWYDDFSWNGFEWIEIARNEKGVIAYLRKNRDNALLWVHHLLDEPLKKITLPLSKIKTVKEVFNSDARIYGGSGQTNLPVEITSETVTLDLPSLTTIVYEVI